VGIMREAEPGSCLTRRSCSFLSDHVIERTSRRYHPVAAFVDTEDLQEFWTMPAIRN